MSVAELYNKQLNCAAIFVVHVTIFLHFVIRHQTLPIVMVDFLEDNRAFVSHCKRLFNCVPFALQSEPESANCR